MANISFQAIDGVDKGKQFLNLETPVTLGREEGNAVRLNDDRVSRFHCKIQEDAGKIVLTDLDSTNGTRVNGETVQLRLLRPGDQICIGRSILVFGTSEEIAAYAAYSGASDRTLPEPLRAGDLEEVAGMGTRHAEPALGASSAADIFHRDAPPLPGQLSPSQAAEMSEIFDFIHRNLALATEFVHISDESDTAEIPRDRWLCLQQVLATLARYSRNIADPMDR